MSKKVSQAAQMGTAIGEIALAMAKVSGRVTPKRVHYEIAEKAYARILAGDPLLLPAAVASLPVQYETLGPTSPTGRTEKEDPESVLRAKEAFRQDAMAFAKTLWGDKVLAAVDDVLIKPGMEALKAEASKAVDVVKDSVSVVGPAAL